MKVSDNDTSQFTDTTENQERNQWIDKSWDDSRKLAKEMVQTWRDVVVRSLHKGGGNNDWENSVADRRQPCTTDDQWWWWWRWAKTTSSLEVWGPQELDVEAWWRCAVQTSERQYSKMYIASTDQSTRTTNYNAIHVPAFCGFERRCRQRRLLQQFEWFPAATRSQSDCSMSIKTLYSRHTIELSICTDTAKSRTMFQSQY